MGLGAIFLIHQIIVTTTPFYFCLWLPSQPQITWWRVATCTCICVRQELHNKITTSLLKECTLNHFYEPNQYHNSLLNWTGHIRLQLSSSSKIAGNRSFAPRNSCGKISQFAINVPILHSPINKTALKPICTQQEKSTPRLYTIAEQWHSKAIATWRCFAHKGTIHSCSQTSGKHPTS